MEHFAICSNPECHYSTPFANAVFAVFALKKEDKDIKKDEDNEISLLPDARYCELCGSPLLFFCPHCKKGVFTISNAVHCGKCAKKIKPGKYDHLGTVINVDEESGDK